MPFNNSNNNDFMNIYALGSNGSGQLGIGHVDDVSAPTWLELGDIQQDDEVATIVAGGNHTLLLFKSGALYASGTNEDSRCGLDGSDTENLCFRRVNLPDAHSKVLHCAATWSASILVTDCGFVLGCGSGSKGELGMGAECTASATLQPIMDLANSGLHVVQLAASMAHVVMVLSDNTVMGWGNGKNGQLGEPAEVVWSPRRIAAPFAVASAACGKDFTILLSVQSRGELLLLGPGKRDRFSLKSSVPTSLPGWTSVAASWGSIFVHLGQELRRYGRDDHGQLGPDSLPAISMFAAGSEHVIALTAAGQVITWGWGEHGNCGLPVDAQKDVKGSFNVLPVPGRVVMLGAGCATTFIVVANE